MGNSNLSYATGYIKPKTTSLFFDYIIRINSDGWFPINLEIEDNIPNAKSCIHYIERDKSVLLPFLHREEVFDHYHYGLGSGRNITDERELRDFLTFMVICKTLYIQNVTAVREKSVNNSYTTNIPACAFVVNYIPDIVEESLSWEQVSDIREDKQSIEKLINFRKWINYLDGRTISEIQNRIETALDDYKNVIRKHGIITATGAVTTVLSATSAFVGAMPDMKRSLISGGLSLAAGAIAYAVEIGFGLSERRNSSVAFLYDVIDTLGG
jgi:hypothetical protein